MTLFREWTSCSQTTAAVLTMVVGLFALEMRSSVDNVSHHYKLRVLVTNQKEQVDCKRDHEVLLFVDFVF